MNLNVGTFTGTYRDLMAIQYDINKNQSQSPSYKIFFAEKIKRFQSLNAIRLGIVQKRMKELVEKHVLFNADNTPMRTEDGKDYVFISDSNKDQFLVAWKEMENLNIEIHY